ncbi:helix-turn-helix domain-containing protein [Chelativorans sp. ZYF759]|uniref:helix-turn-helix domain-containing protein n=1 Tax=Chelativorans sp. ZYF759 TaxID=2692213 RepID=UPI00145F123B|nr:AraC family transcriptional regulator [Chelativorans sp. ZYF759]NMG37622.1 helix-turn-helix domain-containing protein [Chelativorans sp. ZYF759]
MRVERIDSSLHARFWSFNRRPAEAERQVVLLLDGSGEAEVETRYAIASPALLWLGDLKPGRLRTEAGATGFRGTISNDLIIASIGDLPESVDLRYLVDRDFVLSLAGAPDQIGVLERCFNAVSLENQLPREASSLLLSALLRIILVVMLRQSSGSELMLPGVGEKAGLLQRFRQLVEMNFRAHWTIGQYADALGISSDRLHAICTTGIGKPPKALVSERLAQEAVQRMERSSITIQQLGHSLGFNDPAHFSSFFKRMTGMAPSRYRELMVKSRADGQSPQQKRFADWP